MDRILDLGRSNYENGGRTILELSYKFFFETSNYSNFKDRLKQRNKQKDEANQDLDLDSTTSHFSYSNQNGSSVRTRRSRLESRSGIDTDRKEEYSALKLSGKNSKSAFQDVSYQSQRKANGNLIFLLFFIY